MAVLQIHVIREQLRHRIDYVMNPEKTACKGFHSYAYLRFHLRVR